MFDSPQQEEDINETPSQALDLPSSNDDNFSFLVTKQILYEQRFKLLLSNITFSHPFAVSQTSCYEIYFDVADVCFFGLM